MAGIVRPSSKIEPIIASVCTSCGNYSRELPLGGLIDNGTEALPVETCPHCGPANGEAMEIYREIVVASFYN